MTTTTELINSARYDLRDEDDTQYSDAMLLDFLNRGLRPLSVTLASIKSDWVNNSEDLLLFLGDSTIDLPTQFISEITVRISTNYLTKRSVSWIREYLVNSTAGQPENYAIQGTTMMFERVSDAEYTVACEHNESIASLALAENLPYNNEFNDILRQFIIFMAKSRNERILVNDAVMYDFFSDALASKVISRTYIPNHYRTNF